MASMMNAREPQRSAKMMVMVLFSRYWSAAAAAIDTCTIHYDYDYPAGIAEQTDNRKI